MSNGSDENDPSKPRTFLLIWASQAVSLLGTRMSNFMLGVWVYEETSSVTSFTLITAIGLGGGLVISPFMGVLVDRWDRRWAMLVGDAVAGLRTLALLGLLAWGQLEVWHVYVAVGVRTAAEALQIPAYQASITMLIPRGQRSRANGLQELSINGSRVLAPALAGLMMVSFEIWTVLAIDFATFLFALGVLGVVRIPRPPRPAGARSRDSRGWRAASFGWRYIQARPALLRLLAFLAVFNAAIGLSLILVTPLVLSFADAGRLGGVHSTIALGGVLGALLMSTWGGPRNRATGILGFAALCGVSLLFAGWESDLLWVALGLFPFSFAIPLVNACSQTIWQNKVEPGLQGRVFATRTLIAQFTAPFSFVLAGVLADRVFEPLLFSEHGALASTVGRWIGVGEGRGMGLMMILVGFSLLIAALGTWMIPAFRRLEEDLPDAELAVAAVDDHAAAQPSRS